MRRLLVLCLAVALTATATALAATPFDGVFTARKGTAQKDYELSFKVTGGGRTITLLRARLLRTCEGTSASATTTIRPSVSWTVRTSGRFSGRKKETRAGVTTYTTLEGHFSSSMRAVGSVRQESTTPAGRRCDTYRVPFTAKRG